MRRMQRPRRVQPGLRHCPHAGGAALHASRIVVGTVHGARLPILQRVRRVCPRGTRQRQRSICADNATRGAEARHKRAPAARPSRAPFAASRAHLAFVGMSISGKEWFICMLRLGEGRTGSARTRAQVVVLEGRVRERLSRPRVGGLRPGGVSRAAAGACTRGARAARSRSRARRPRTLP